MLVNLPYNDIDLNYYKKGRYLYFQILKIALFPYIILLMLKLKSEPSEDRFTRNGVLKQFKKRIRKQELHLIFQTIRKNMMNQSQQRNQPQFYMQPELPMYNQVPPNYYDYLNYVMKMVPPQYYQSMIVQTSQNFNSNLPLQIMPEVEEKVYFEKNGIVVYKKLLGSGTYSHVWEGKIRRTGQKIAAKQVKKLEPNELKCLQELTSEYIVKVIDIFTHSSKTFIILECCNLNLKEELKNCDFQLEKALKYFEEIVYGMDVLQSKNIIHRDLKCQNILVKDQTIKIADFGLAKFMGNELEVESRQCGTPYTMAPQVYFSNSQRKISYTLKSDIWSIGVILHEILYKIHPFNGNSLEFKKQRRVKIKRKYGYLDQLIDRCLQFDPILRIDWSEFRKLFSFYLKEKHLYPIRNSPKELPVQLIQRPKQEKPEIKVMKKGRRVCEEEIQCTQVKKEQHPRQRISRKQSRDVREDRTPIKMRRQPSPKQTIKQDRQAYFCYEKERERNRRRYQYKQTPEIQKKIQKKIQEMNKQPQKQNIICERPQQQPFHNPEIVPRPRKMFTQTKQPTTRMRCISECLILLLMGATVVFTCILH